MQEINVKAVCKSKNLDYDYVAEQLFPEAKYARLALNRAVKIGSLNQQQISKLSLLSGVPIGELFSGGWKSSEDADGVLRFTNEDYTAELCTRTWVTKIYHKKSMFHESVIHGGGVTLSAFIDVLNSEIIKYNANADFRN